MTDHQNLPIESFLSGHIDWKLEDVLPRCCDEVLLMTSGVMHVQCHERGKLAAIETLGYRTSESDSSVGFLVALQLMRGQHRPLHLHGAASVSAAERQLRALLDDGLHVAVPPGRGVVAAPGPELERRYTGSTKVRNHGGGPHYSVIEKSSRTYV